MDENGDELERRGLLVEPDHFDLVAELPDALAERVDFGLEVCSFDESVLVKVGLERVQDGDPLADEVDRKSVV